MSDIIDKYWRDQTDAMDKIVAEGRTVEDVIAILNEYFEPSSGDAFFPGGGDEEVLSTLMQTPGWTFPWIQASYYFAARDANGDGLTYVEGDVSRGVQRPLGVS